MPSPNLKCTDQSSETPDDSQRNFTKRRVLSHSGCSNSVPSSSSRALHPGRFQRHKLSNAEHIVKPKPMGSRSRCIYALRPSCKRCNCHVCLEPRVTAVEDESCYKNMTFVPSNFRIMPCITTTRLNCLFQAARSLPIASAEEVPCRPR